jgi:hypothetical protein
MTTIYVGFLARTFGDVNPRKKMFFLLKLRHVCRGPILTFKIENICHYDSKQTASGILFHGRDRARVVMGWILKVAGHIFICSALPFHIIHS